MRKNFIIWLVFVSLFLLLVVQGVYADLFVDNMGLIYRSTAINLLPLSALLVWSFYTGNVKSGKLATALLILFSLGCIASLYARNFLPAANAYESFFRVFGNVPFFLLPLQLFIGVLLLRDNKPDNSISETILVGRGAQVQALIGDARTVEALDLALETVGEQDEPTTQRLLTLKNTLVKAKDDAGLLLISSDELRAVEARVANSLLEML